jgi:hypothetical protein
MEGHPGMMGGFEFDPVTDRRLDTPEGRKERHERQK